MNFSRDTTSGQEGVELFHAIRELEPDMPVILLTAWTDLETAVGLVRAGAADYLGKPWDDEKLISTVRNLLELGELRSQKRKLLGRRKQSRDELAAKFDLCGLVYRSEAMHSVLSLATQVAHADVPVLITGANGTGKDLLASIIQTNSTRHQRPFVTVNVGALPNELMEAELFGAEAGAFTGAGKLRHGRFENADGGTLFLDEIGNLSATGQMKLLRVLQTGEYERLGSSSTRRVDVRVISATNTDLGKAISEGRFREDLYYRLNVIEINIPPLSQRREDILPLAEHFLAGAANLSSSARDALLKHNWPGNVRELENGMQRASLLAGTQPITPELLGLGSARGKQVPEPSADTEKNRIEQALNSASGQISEAARQLGISRQALYRRMEKFGIEV
jgi:DNA-binding NtrC family response regulator